MHLWTSLGFKRIHPNSFNQWRLDALSIPHFVIKKVRPHGARHGKIEAQKEQFVAHNARKRCIKKNYDGIHDRFQRDPVYRDSQLKNWLDRGEKCIAMDKLAQEDHSYRLSYEEYERNQKTLVSHTEQIGQECTDETPIRLPNRSHINELSPPRIRRRTSRTNSFSTVPKVAPVFFQFFMVELG